jgi:glycosyltransferase involved in cell wall biosynthesis
MSNLAIVIPAYKKKFLSRTLECLVNQTNQDFSVYIGNDAGEEGIEEIVSIFRTKLNICYHYFSENVGGTSLVKQWYRCLSLIKNEEWTWLLPDDDFADPQCVAFFYKFLESANTDLFRFNVKFVNADESVFKTNPPLKIKQDSFESLLEKLSFFRASTVAEFIFDKNKFLQIGFKEIPMAWGTDDLLWYEMGAEKGIYGCNDAYVYLRQSDLNFSNNYATLSQQKIDSNFIFFKKLIASPHFAEVANNKIENQKFITIAINHIMFNLQDYNKVLSLKEMIKYAALGNNIWGGGLLKNVRRFYLNNKLVIKKTNNKYWKII